MSSKQYQAPKLYVIAGPNGSGKSAFSSFFTGGLKAFDADEQLTHFMKLHPRLSEDFCSEQIRDEVFPSAKLEAINQQRDFAYETNFESDDPMFSVREFKAEGYITSLTFLGMDDLVDSITRVQLRVDRGKHDVGVSRIKYNFEKGFENLCQFYSSFDFVSLVDNPVTFPDKPPVEYLVCNKNGHHIQKRPLPAWVARFVQRLA